AACKLPGGEEGKHHHRDLDHDRLKHAFGRTIHNDAENTARRREAVKHRRTQNPLWTPAKECHRTRNRTCEEEGAYIGTQRIATDIRERPDAKRFTHFHRRYQCRCPCNKREKPHQKGRDTSNPDHVPSPLFHGPFGKKTGDAHLERRPSVSSSLCSGSEVLDDLFHHLLRIAEEHHGVVTEEEFVLHTRIARAHAALDEENGLRLFNVENRHAIDRA